MSGVPRMIQTIRRLMSEMGLKPSNTFDQKPRLPLFFLALTGESTRPPSTIGSPSSSSCRSRAAFLAARRLPGRPRGAQRLMEPKQIMSPRGMEPTSVTTKSLSVCTKPSLSADITVWNMCGNHSYPSRKQRAVKSSAFGLYFSVSCAGLTPGL